MDNLYGENYIKRIMSYIPNAKPVAGRTELLVRCRFCGDSSNPNHAHMYISVPRDNTELSFYDCKKCPAGGIVDDELLRKYGVTDSEFLIEINKHNSEILKTPKYKTLKKIDVYPLRNQYIRNDNNNEDKLKYINDRIGSNFNYNDILGLKISLNLYDVLNSNNLELTRHKNITDSLDKHFIGFVSYDNSFINMRKVTTEELYHSINKRYINYNLVNKPDTSKNYYIIPTQLDILNPEPIKIHISEGPFDILSIYYNLNNCNKFQNIYISCGGKGYLNSLEFVLKELGIINFEVHYYPDADVKQWEIDFAINKIIKLNCPIYIHRNSYNGEKDYGVPIDRIKDNIFKIN